MGNAKTVSFTTDQELIDAFDEAINQRKLNQDIEMGKTRSEVFRELMREYIAQTNGVSEGNGERAALAAD